MKDWLLQDPLHEILERHLFRAATESENSTQMINAVVADYLMYLDSQSVHIPWAHKAVFIEDLKEEIRELTIRKTFGAVSIELNPSGVPSPSAKTNRRLV